MIKLECICMDVLFQNWNVIAIIADVCVEYNYII